MRKCGGCGVVRYCGERCQKRGWKKGHKGECAGMREMGEREKAKGVGGGGGNEEGKGGEEEVGEGGMEDVGDPEDELWEE